MFPPPQTMYNEGHESQFGKHCTLKQMRQKWALSGLKANRGKTPSSRLLILSK